MRARSAPGTTRTCSLPVRSRVPIPVGPQTRREKCACCAPLAGSGTRIRTPVSGTKTRRSDQLSHPASCSASPVSPDGRTRTCDLLVPNQAPYQLGHIRSMLLRRGASTQCIGTGGRVRTCNLLGNNQALRQLSYPGMTHVDRDGVEPPQRERRVYSAVGSPVPSRSNAIETGFEPATAG